MQLLRHSGIYFLARGIPGIVSVASLAIFTRMLPPTEYGAFVLVIAGADLLDAVLLHWLYYSVIRFSAVYEEKSDAFYSTILAAYYMVLIPAVIAAIVGGFIRGQDLSPGLIVAGLIYFVVHGWFSLNLERARAGLKPVTYGILDMSRAVLSLALAAGLAAIGWGPVGLLIGLTVGRLLPPALLYRGPWKGVRPWHADREVLRRLLIFGLPLGVSVALAFVVSLSDRLIVGAMLGTEQAGLYGAGYDVAYRGMIAVMTVLNLAGYPLVVKALETKGVEGSHDQLRQYFTIFLLVSGAAMMAFIFLAKDLAYLMLGKGFRQAGTMLIPWVAVGVFLSGLRTFYFNYAFQLGEKTVAQIWVSLVPAAVNVVLNLFWIPKFGLIGAAQASVVAFAIAIVLSAIVGGRVFPMPLPWLESLKVILAVGAGSWALVETGMLTGLWGVILRVGTAVVAGSLVMVAVNLLGVRTWLIGLPASLGGDR